MSSIYASRDVSKDRRVERPESSVSLGEVLDSALFWLGR